MGLDQLELTLRIEETFSIEIPDEVAPGLLTPRQVTDYILTQVGESPSPLVCLTQKAFHLLRQRFTQHLQMPRSQFKPDTRLKEIVPEADRDQIWKEIGSSLGVRRWPSISRPMWLAFIPVTVRDVRSLIEYLVTNHPLVVKGEEIEWTRAQVWEVLKRVIIDELQVKDFSEDSRFVQDMGLN